MYFTIKAFSDRRSMDGPDFENAWLARSYRAARRDSEIVLTFVNASVPPNATTDGEVTVHIDGKVDGFDRAYVENPQGETVARYIANVPDFRSADRIVPAAGQKVGGAGGPIRWVPDPSEQ